MKKNLNGEEVDPIGLCMGEEINFGDFFLLVFS